MLVVNSQHLGQQPEYLPTARGFDAFLGLPFSVDDGLGIVVPANCPEPPENDRNQTIPAAAAQSADFEGIPMVGAGANLGPSLPLPLIRQSGQTESLIVEQPTNLRLLNQRLVDAAINFTSIHAEVPFFVYLLWQCLQRSFAEKNMFDKFLPLLQLEFILLSLPRRVVGRYFAFGHVHTGECFLQEYMQPPLLMLPEPSLSVCVCAHACTRACVLLDFTCVNDGHSNAKRRSGVKSVPRQAICPLQLLWDLSSRTVWRRSS